MNRIKRSPRSQSGNPKYGWPRWSFERPAGAGEFHFLSTGQARSAPVPDCHWILEADNRSLFSSGCGIPPEKGVVQLEGNAQ
jgi:hypothetical protein